MNTNETFSGLNKEQVAESRLKYGMNISGEMIKHRTWNFIKDIIVEPLFILLVVAAIVYFITGNRQEGIIMIASLSFVAGISLYQENKSRNAIDALEKLNAPRAKVFREGVKFEIASKEIVLGDIIVVDDGNIIPCDCEILRLNDFSVNESILTGESLPVNKDLNGDNKIFQGTFVQSGSCIGKAIAIGSGTKLGQIGKSLGSIKSTPTPLQLQIRSFVRSMVIVGSIAFFIVWGVNYYTSKSLLHGLMHGLTLAMSILPEEIPVAFSTFMALGAFRLYKQNVIARSAVTVETLGAATVVCADKTGTLTQNIMHLAAVYDFSQDKIHDYTKNEFDYNPVIEYSMWASEIEPFDPMEKSIHDVYAKTTPSDLRSHFSMIKEYPISGQPPVMTHIFSNQSETIVAAKGALEGILNQTSLSNIECEKIKSVAATFALRGYRILGVGKGNLLGKFPENQQQIQLEFLGVIAFYDPPKQNINETIEKFYSAGIDLIMITGDYAETALAIAGQIGMKNKVAVSGAEVLKMDMSELQSCVKRTGIFSRMFPEAKLKIIEALKANGEVVAMTGDGVNDAPALKSAHIGIAMGKRGSEVAKDAASLILVDDDLSHMPDAVALGRRIYENLKKAIQYIISIHIPIILIVTLPLVLMWKYSEIFSPVHVIFLELIMGPTCSIVFENEPIEADSMIRKPRKMTTTFFSWKELSLSVLQGVMISICCLGAGYYFMSVGASDELTRTIIYTILIFSNVFLTLVNRSFYYSAIATLNYKNKLVPVILILSLAILFCSIYIKPVQNLFHFTTISVYEIFVSVFIAFAGVAWVELVKIYRRFSDRSKRTQLYLKN